MGFAKTSQEINVSRLFQCFKKKKKMIVTFVLNVYTPSIIPLWSEEQKATRGNCGSVEKSRLFQCRKL